MAKNTVDNKERLFCGIGNIVVQFQLIEHTVSEVLASLLEMKSKSDIYRITAAMSYAQKVNLMCELYNERKKTNWPHIDINITHEALNAAESFRNTIVHSLWHINGDSWTRTKPNLRKKARLNIKSEIVDIETIENGATYLYAIREFYLGNTNELVDAKNKLSSLLNKSNPS